MFRQICLFRQSCFGIKTVNWVILGGQVNSLTMESGIVECFLVAMELCVCSTISVRVNTYLRPMSTLT